MPQEPLSNDDVIARLESIQKHIDKLKLLIKELQEDAKN